MDTEDTKPLTLAYQYLQSGSVGEAVKLCRSILAREPGNVSAHQLLGIIAGQAGDFAAAAGHFAAAIALAPGQSGLHRSLAFACRALGNGAGAESSFRQAIALAPGDVALINDLGNLLWTQGRLEDARRVYEQALAIAPESRDARFALASILSSLEFYHQAVQLFRKLEQEAPDFSGLQVNLGLALMKLGRCEEAIACYDRALAANPDDYMACNNRGNALRNQQRMDEAVNSFRRALTIKPDHANAHSNLLLTMNYTERSQEVIYRESLRFDVQQAAAFLPAMAVFSNTPDAERVLRVGYVSADFRQHSVAFFLSGVLAAHDRERVRVSCYSNVARPDRTTAQLQAMADDWVSITGLSDAIAADRIRADGIDILVDLGGHTGGNRLLVFARRPAPVQVNWLGYPNTTGLQAMDFRLTDSVADPPGDADALHTEVLVRLPSGFLCYQPASNFQSLSTKPETGGPETSDRELTFGSFNTLSKITADVIAVWSAILRQLPASRLLLKSDSLNDPGTRHRYQLLFGQHGIAPDRLELIDWLPSHQHHLELYSRVDIALDPFPYNGTTTTCEALWMGVPVLSLRGSRHAARVGASLLSHAGLPEWIADDERHYIEMAVTRGADRPALAGMRATVARRMQATPLLDSAGFTRSLERAYRDMWVGWCAGSASRVQDSRHLS